MGEARITDINFIESHNKTNDIDIVVDIHGVVEKPIKSIQINYMLER